MEVIKKYWVILLIGLILRLTIAAFTFQSDVKAPALVSAVFLELKSLNPYEDSKKLQPGEILDDLPMTYYLALPINIVSKWMTTDQTEKTFLLSHNLLFGKPEMWGYLIYIKLPQIVFDLALGILLTLSVISDKRKKVLLLWIFNPMTLWATAAIGQIDIYVAFFIALTWFFLKKNKLGLAALSLGFGIASKSSPLIILPFLIGVAKSWPERIKLVAIAIIPYLVVVIPYLPSQEFRKNALLASQLDKSFYARLPLSGAEGVIIVPVIILALSMIYFSRSRDIKDFLIYSITALLLTLSFTHFHIQWFLWVTPLLIIYLIENWKEKMVLPVFGLTIALIMMLFLFESSLQLKLFAPLIPELDNAKGLAELLSNEQLNFFRSLSASIFMASSVSLIFNLFNKND